jgi:hypothetical protein
VISMVSLLPAKIILLENKRRTIPVDRVWEGWKAKKPAFHPSHTPSCDGSGRGAALCGSYDRTV